MCVVREAATVKPYKRRSTRSRVPQAAKRITRTSHRQTPSRPTESTAKRWLLVCTNIDSIPPTWAFRIERRANDRRDSSNPL
jgi:hypothetical protein